MRSVRPAISHSGPALIGRTIADSRTRTVAFAYIFGVYAWLEAAGFKSAYPTPADRVSFARTFAGNDAIRLFYGYPYDVSNVGGYSAWRVGGTLAIAAAAFGILAGVRAMRTEEEQGRADLVLAAPVSRRTLLTSGFLACGTQAVVLGIAEWLGLVAGRLPVAGAAFLAASTVAVLVVFVGVGALASQLASTGRGALGLGGAIAIACWLGRVVSDTVPGAGWVRWLTPLGWSEAARPFAGSHLGVLAVPAACIGVLVAATARIASKRDVGIGLIPGRSDSPPHVRLLRSIATHGFQAQRGLLAAWGLGICAAAAVLGMVATSVPSAGLSKKLRSEIERLGAGPITTPAGYLGLIFLVFVVVICLFACAQVNLARNEEQGHQVETLLALPLGRGRWLTSRLSVALVGIVVLSQLASLLTWAGAVSQGDDIPLWRLSEAGWNCAAAGLLFLGIASLVWAVAPGPAGAISYLLLGVSFLWYVVGALLRLPRWLLDATPFQHIGLVPAEPFQAVAAGAFVLIGSAAGVAALTIFRRRDLCR